jgi:hypothetical protein
MEEVGERKGTGPASVRRCEVKSLGPERFEVERQRRRYAEYPHTQLVARSRCPGLERNILAGHEPVTRTQYDPAPVAGNLGELLKSASSLRRIGQETKEILIKYPAKKSASCACFVIAGVLQ